MPKVIENVPQQLLAEARRQVATVGYAKTTVRSVAAACGIAPGTVYNYFPSKDVLVASFMAQDWLSMLSALSDCDKGDRRAYLEKIYVSLAGFCESHSALFNDVEAGKKYLAASQGRHGLLRDQLADLVLDLCTFGDARFISRFIAESLLTWAPSGVEFSSYYNVIEKILS